jgi:hypothetical protein
MMTVGVSKKAAATSISRSQPSMVASKTAQEATRFSPGNSIPLSWRTTLWSPSQPTSHWALTSKTLPSRSRLAVTPDSPSTNPTKRVEWVTEPPTDSR